MPQRNSAPSRCLLSEMVVLALALFQVAWQIHSCKLQVCWAKTPQYPTTSVFSCHYNYIYLPLHSVHQSFKQVILPCLNPIFKIFSLLPSTISSFSLPNEFCSFSMLLSNSVSSPIPRSVSLTPFHIGHPGLDGNCRILHFHLLNCSTLLFFFFSELVITIR